MRVVNKYRDAFSANMAKGMLENAGIKAAVLNENMPMYVGMCNTDLLCIELVVSEEDYSEACKLIAAASKAE